MSLLTAHADIIYYMCMEHLTFFELLALRRTCKTMHAACPSDSAWVEHGMLRLLEARGTSPTAAATQRSTLRSLMRLGWVLTGGALQEILHRERWSDSQDIDMFRHAFVTLHDGTEDCIGKQNTIFKCHTAAEARPCPHPGNERLGHARCTKATVHRARTVGVWDVHNEDSRISGWNGPTIDIVLAQFNAASDAEIAPTMSDIRVHADGGYRHGMDPSKCRTVSYVPIPGSNLAINIVGVGNLRRTFPPRPYHSCEGDPCDLSETVTPRDVVDKIVSTLVQFDIAALGCVYALPPGGGHGAVFLPPELRIEAPKVTSANSERWAGASEGSKKNLKQRLVKYRARGYIINVSD